LSWLILILVFLLVAVKNNNKNSNYRVSVVIPAFNEAETVGHVVKVVKALKYVTEIIVVDDGSTDETAEVAEEAGAKVIMHPFNWGKGAAISTGYKTSEGDVVAFIDADLPKLTTKQVENIIRPILEGKADVTKTKFKREAGRVTELTAKPLLNFFFPEIKFDQPLSGQFAAKRSALNKIKFEEDYGVDVGIVLDAEVKGLKIKEVDIGRIDHQMSSLKELNVVANEVVRTIVDRAMEYGRVTMMDTLGKYIRMGVLGLSLASLGVFGVFFIRAIPPTIWMVIAVMGIIMAVYYIIKVIRRSYVVLARSEGRSQSIRSFTYMHFPLIVSGVILVAMFSTLLGAVHVDDGKISIEPTSGNLIIWKNSSDNHTFDVRGPYKVDSALENENTSIRIPSAALDTLGLNYGDKLYIKGQGYVLNQSRPGEDNILRIPLEVRQALNLEVGDVIPDGNLRKVFNNVYMESTVPLSGQEAANTTLQQGIFLTTVPDNGRIIDIYLDNEKVGTTSGILKNGSYVVYVNGYKAKTIYFDEKVPEKTYIVYWGNHVIKIMVGDEVKTDMEFSQSRGLLSGRFLVFNFE
jgi:glucosyl-3-phosphoglycerate synthase